MRVLSVILLLIGSVAESLKLYRVDVPHYKRQGESAELQCEFDMGRDRLYAVKWYKDNEEFFRYVPRFNPSIHTHQVDGVHVDTVSSNAEKVVLKSVNVRSTGVYRCEVSAEAPSFASFMGEGRMTVVYLPKEGPQITGTIRDEYEVGDTLDLNCTSSKSFPPSQISWYINDMPVVPHNEQSYYDSSVEIPSTTTGLLNGKPTNGNTLIRATSRRLHMELTHHHFGPKGTAKVRCVARIFPLFWQDGDEKKIDRGNSNSKDNKKTTNEVDYSHDSLHFQQPQFQETPNTRLGSLYKGEALVQIRGGCSKVLMCTELLVSVELMLLILVEVLYLYP